jgi:predicted aspartyl protease
MKSCVGVFALLITLLPGAPASAQRGCTATPIASLPLRLEQGRVLVEITINQQPVWFAVDTGASHSVLDRRLVERLRLPTRIFRSMGASDIGGSRVETLVYKTIVAMGAWSSGRFSVYIVADLSVDGLLAADILGRFDVDLDFAGARMTLFKRSACTAPPGPGPFKTISSAVMFETNRIRTPVMLDGKEHWAIVDTGASRSYIAASAARAGFGIDMDKLPSHKARAVYGAELLVAPHDFTVLQIGDVTLPNPRLSLTRPENGFGDSPVLLGLEHLQNLRLFIAYGGRRLVISPARQP